MSENFCKDCKFHYGASYTLKCKEPSVQIITGNYIEGFSTDKPRCYKVRGLGISAYRSTTGESSKCCKLYVPSWNYKLNRSVEAWLIGELWRGKILPMFTMLFGWKTK